MWVTNPSPSEKLKVLGHGVVLNAPSRVLDPLPHFPNAIEHWTGNPIIVRERVMISVIGTLTDKVDWQRKINDPVTVGKWRDEIKQMEQEVEDENSTSVDEAGDDDNGSADADADEDEDMEDDESDADVVLGPATYGGFSENMFDYCIEEMGAYAQQLERDGFFPALDATATVYKSDTLVSDELRDSLRAAAAPLEDVSDDQQDWHPGSDQQVLDLVHPSLFPLLYGRSKILSDRTVPLGQGIEHIGLGEKIPGPGEEEVIVSTAFDPYRTAPEALYSSRFQWLPCEVAFVDQKQVKITSYINNLHPIHHKDLYSVIEKIIAKAIPMWDATLTSTNQASAARPSRIQFDGNDYIKPDVPDRPSTEDEDQMDSEEIAEADNEFRRNWVLENLEFPEPESYAPRAAHSIAPSQKINLRESFAESGLQIIVKLANVHLTPENPVYEGGKWHVEGQLNEHICASALYYYDSENITDSYLEFREQMRATDVESTSYEQNEYQFLERLYDIENWGSVIQHLASVQTKQGRLVTFPNVFQHRVKPFELEDETKPGHRKLLALFLVDPTLRIPSTANVPPQQREWATDLQDVTASTIGLEGAKRLREELMAERSVYTEQVDKRILATTFSFCEH